MCSCNGAVCKQSETEDGDTFQGNPHQKIVRGRRAILASGTVRFQDCRETEEKKDNKSKKTDPILHICICACALLLLDWAPPDLWTCLQGIRADQRILCIPWRGRGVLPDCQSPTTHGVNAGLGVPNLSTGTWICGGEIITLDHLLSYCRAVCHLHLAPLKEERPSQAVAEVGHLARK